MTSLVAAEVSDVIVLQQTRVQCNYVQGRPSARPTSGSAGAHTTPEDISYIAGLEGGRRSYTPAFVLVNGRARRKSSDFRLVHHLVVAAATNNVQHEEMPISTDGHYPLPPPCPCQCQRQSRAAYMASSSAIAPFGPAPRPRRAPHRARTSATNTTVAAPSTLHTLLSHAPISTTCPPNVFVRDRAFSPPTRCRRHERRQRRRTAAGPQA